MIGSNIFSEYIYSNNTANEKNSDSQFKLRVRKVKGCNWRTIQYHAFDNLLKSVKSDIQISSTIRQEAIYIP